MPRRLITYALLIIIALILGTLAGWYFFIRSQTVATEDTGTARGFDTGAASPFGAGSGGGNTGAIPSASSTSARPAQLWRLAKTPSAGVGFATTTAGLRVRFVERATGYIFDSDPVSGNISRVGGALMPKIYEARIASNGRVLMRSLGEGGITTFAGRLSYGTTTSFSGTKLTPNIEDAVADPKSDNVIYLAPAGVGVSVVSAAWDGDKQKQLASLPVRGWRLLTTADGRLIIAEKAADGVSGYAYELKGSTLQKLLGPVSGLTVLPQSGGSLLFGSSRPGVTLYARLAASSSAAALPVATVADKCVWMPQTTIAYCAVPQTPVIGAFLDRWYRGELHTSDAWWRIDARSGQAELVFAPSSSVSLDVIDPQMDSGGEYIAFINNIDLSPWVLRLNK